MNKPDLKKLAKKFPEQDIEWRVQQCGQGTNGPWALVIPYITNRAIMSRLDEAVGQANWKNEFKSSPCGKGYLCGISIKLDGEWVTRWDGAEISESNNIDDVKSTLSSSMKRTGVQWGIGRYLYQFEAMFADAKHCDNRYNLLPGYTYQNSKDKKSGAYFGFQWRPKPLEAWALPVTDKEVNNYLKAMAKAKSNEELKLIFGGAYKLSVSEDDNELLEIFTKAKDKAKQLLADKIKQSNNDIQDFIKKIVNDQIEIINSAVNESSVNGLALLSIEKIKEHASGNQLKEAIEEIKRVSYNKVNQLRG